MCGILAWRHPPSSAATGQFEAALQLQDHRGPDARRTAYFPDIWLGHNRLSILDLSERGNQPMQDASGRYTIIFNGEIYNFLELKTELLAADPRLVFSSGTDTEVILAAFIQWDVAAFDRFNGMWAVVIWDQKESRLVVSRDRFGIKPLYVLREGRSIAVASEIKPLLHLSAFAPRASLAAIARFFATGNVDGHTDTWFQGIERFPAGANLEIDREGRERWHRIRMEVPQIDRPFDEVEEAFESLLTDAVSISMRSDVPVGMCLSGGTDSSVIACFAAKHGPIESFTCRYQGADSDEFPWVQQLAAGRPIGLNPISPDEEDILGDCGKILWHLEEPAKATGVLSQWNVMRLAKGKVTVLLDGQGGDEVFGGYDFHRLPYIAGLLWNADGTRALAEAKAWGMNKTCNAGLQAGLEKVKRPLRQALTPLRGASVAQRTPWTDMFLFKHIVEEIGDRDEPPLRYGLHGRLKWDVAFEMLPALLRYEDKLSMAFSIESRVPLLDHRVVAFASALRPSDLIRNGWSKWPLRRMLDRQGASAIAWRRDKMGFPTPMNRYWSKISDRILIWLSRGQLAERGIIDPTRVEPIVRADLSQPHGRLVWHLLQAEWWHRTFIDGNFRSPLAWT